MGGRGGGEERESHESALALRSDNTSLEDLDHDQGNSRRPLTESGDISPAAAGYLERLARGSRRWSECRIKATGRTTVSGGVSWGRTGTGAESGEGGEGGARLRGRWM